MHPPLPERPVIREEQKLLYPIDGKISQGNLLVLDFPLFYYTVIPARRSCRFFNITIQGYNNESAETYEPSGRSSSVYRFALKVYGCQMNVYDGDKMKTALVSMV